MSQRLLIIDDDIAICRTLQLHFSNEGYDVLVAHSAEDGLITCANNSIDVAILDIRMSGRSGLQVLPELKSRYPTTRTIMITAFHDMESTIEAMQGGADDYIHKPIDLDELDLAVSKALRYQQKSEEEVKFESEDSANSQTHIMVGHSRAMKEVFKTIGRVASSMATVLITGESGTGKELVARAIHRVGRNPDGPFVAVNCAAVVETLLESDLFGHEKGAFTGAVTRQIGKFALADGGTIFLDEISEMSPAMQAKLLRVLQEKEYSPIGAKESQTTAARVVAATNVNLIEALEKNSFREDLYYRLQVVNIHLPPLRERLEDIPDLVENMLARINRDMHRTVRRVSLEVIEHLGRYHWPGNIRELENVLTKAVALCPGDIITTDMLPANLIGDDQAVKPDEPVSSNKSLLDVEKNHVSRVLRNTNWHKGQACKILGVSRPRLRRLIALHGLTPTDNMDPSNDIEWDCE